MVVAREAEYRIPPGSRASCAVENGVAELYFTRDLTGYGWCVRKGEVMNVGIGRLGRRLVSDEVEAFRSDVRVRRGVESPHLEGWRGHAYAAGAPPSIRRTGDGLVLVGDAAGLANDRSGEGIGPAVESGMIAAAVIAEAHGDLCAGRLSRYERLVAERWRQQGRIGSIGFSTHGPLPLILEAIESDRFSYINLHWYYIQQRNRPAIEAATAHHMGVFLISPTDKGGHLHSPSARLLELCAPLHPIVFNDL